MITISGTSLSFRARENFFYDTTFTLPAGTDLPQLHATIVRSSAAGQADIGRVVVAVFKLDLEALTLIVIDDFDGPLSEPVDMESDWATIEADWRLDRYSLKKAQPK